MSRLKLFAGIELDERARAACARVSARLQAQALEARFEEPVKLHVTLAFLGYVEAERVADVTAALERAARACEPFTLVLNKVSAFPNERNPHIVWIGCRRAPPQFRPVAQTVRGAFEALGFRFDKPPVAHVTIARIKKSGMHLPLLEIAPIRVTVRALTLFESIPDARTTRYEVRARAPLVSADE